MNTVPVILALDSATTGCSVAVWRNGVCAHESQTMSRGQAEALMPMMSRILAAAKVDAAQLDAVAVTIGPGAFTGLRIGMASARAFALALGVPCMGVSTFEAIAASVTGDARGKDGLMVAVETKREDLYVQLFNAAGVAVGAGDAIEMDALADFVVNGLGPDADITVAGDGAARALAALSQAGGVTVTLADGGAELPDAAFVAQVASRSFPPPPNAPPPAPLYLRPVSAKLPTPRP